MQEGCVGPELEGTNIMAGRFVNPTRKSRQGDGNRSETFGKLEYDMGVNDSVQ